MPNSIAAGQNSAMLMLKLSCGPHGCYLEGGGGTGQHQACKWVTNSQPSVHLHVHSSCASSYTFPLHTLPKRLLQAAAFFDVYEALQIGHKLSDCSPVCGSYLAALHCALRVHASCASSKPFHCTHWAASIRRANGSPTLVVCKLSTCTSHPCQNYLSCIGAWPRKSDATYIMKFLKAFLTSAEL